MFWNLYAEGHVTGIHKAMQLNENPIQAATFNEAIQRLAQGHPQGHLFEKTDIGWTYRGCRIFDTELAARVALG